MGLQFWFENGNGNSYPAPTQVLDEDGKQFYILGQEWDRGAPSQTHPVAIPISRSDEDVPYISEVKAMIPEMDLYPKDQDLYTQVINMRSVCFGVCDVVLHADAIHIKSWIKGDGNDKQMARKECKAH